MSWFNVWDGLKNKICRYMLQRYLGQFLEDKLNLEQLKVELYDGKATVKNVSLKVEAINELIEGQGWAVEVINGHIGDLTVTVPWNALMTNDSFIEVSDLIISLRPIKRQNDGTSMVESMWSSASSSMKLAEECMKQTDDTEYYLESQTKTLIGLEKFAETIDNVLNRVKAKFSNTLLILEYPSINGCKSYSISIELQNVSYKNETGSENRNLKNVELHFKSDVPELTTEKIHLLPMFAKHNISICGMKLYTEELHSSEEQLNRNCIVNDRIIKRIPIIEFRKEQKIQIKMKQLEEIKGPKVFLEVELGSIYFLATPRQIHLVLKILSAFDEDTGLSKLNSNPCNQNNKTDINYGMYASPMSGNLGNQGNWVDNFEEPFKYSNSYFNNISPILTTDKYCDSLNTSISSISIDTNCSKIPLKTTNTSSCSEILNFDLKVSSVIGIILQEDILIENKINCRLFNENSELEMHKTAEYFFNSVGDKSSDVLGRTSYLCKKNHIYFQLNPILADGIQHRNKSTLMVKFTVSITELNIYEVLEDVPKSLINFDRIENCNEGFYKRPDVTIAFKSSFYNTNEKSKTLFNISLEKNIIEVDISMYDRLSYILGPSPFSETILNNVSDEKINLHRKSNLSTDYLTEVNILASSLDIILRFPIYDARPLDDPERVPWWKQNIRSDFVLFNFYQFKLYLKSHFLTITANEINAYYCEKNVDTKVHILNTTILKSNPSVNIDSVHTYPNIVFELVPYEHIVNYLTTNGLENDKNFESSMYKTTNETNLPFSSKRTCRQSDTRHSKRDSLEPETILLPGDTDEINQFRYCTMNTSKIQIKINLPFVNLIFDSKQLYELIYNRLNSDLFMWEPSSPILKSSNSLNVNLCTSKINGNLMDSINMNSSKNLQKSIETNVYSRKENGFERDNSDTNYLFGVDSSNSIYFSTHEKEEDENIRYFNKIYKSSNCSIEICVGEGSIIFLVPVRNSDNHVLPGQLGKFHIKINALKIFSVTGYNNNDQLAYFCLQLKYLEVFHCGLIPANAFRNKEIEEYMQSIFYKIPKGLTKTISLECDKSEMVSLVIEIKKVPEQKIKRLKITVGVQRTTFRFHPAVTSRIWLNQLIDFLDVSDYPVQGYQPFGIITELQLHLWSCAIDYRPKYLDYRAIIEVGAFTISSNIISSINGCNLRFFVEECILSIASFEVEQKEYPDYIISFIPSKHLIPVVDIGLLDISLRIDEKSNISPKFDMRCSIHDVHIYTCSDSGSALAQLIAYVANDGDIFHSDDYDHSTSLQFSECETNLITANETNIAPQVTTKQQERVNLMMAEVLQENFTQPKEKVNESIKQQSVEIFFFPDESKLCDQTNSDSNTEIKDEFCEIYNFEKNVMSNSYFTKDTSNTLPQVKADLGDLKIINGVSLDANAHEEDYCIITDDKYFIQHCGIKNVTITDEPLQIVDNHFCLPFEKPDLLKSPESFPMAVVRYTLCEMTLTWHLYGGHDFQNASYKVNDIKSKNEKTLMSDIYQKGVSFSKAAHNFTNVKKVKDKLTWKSQGGSSRNHEILVEIVLSKVRFSHEEYPHHSAHAARQVLLINEIEIRDRLQTSDINKFLYHSSITNISNKNSQHMVVIKALHVRPNPEQISSQECSLRISISPLRLHIDQDTLVFLVDFFSNIGDVYNTDISNINEKKTNSNRNNIVNEITGPIMAVENVPETVQDIRVKKLVSSNLNLLMEDEKDSNVNGSNRNINMQTTTGSCPIYFREIIFSPEVKICLDYHGRHVELSRGPFAGLLMGLAQLQCSEIRLRKLVYRRGILGVEKLLTYLCKEWLKDIKRNQLPKILSGVGPTYAFLQLFQGIYDLFWLPIEQYQKDGRLIKGFQLGAQSFTARTALAALEITSRIIQLLQITAETAFDMVSPGPSVKRSRKLKRGKKKRPLQPRDIREGVTNAYHIVKEGINDSANTLIETAVAEHDQKGYSGAVGAVMRQIPQLVVCPAVLATQATTNILGGVKSSLVPEAKVEAREKWKIDEE